MKLLLLAALIAVPAQAENIRDVKLTDACKASLEKFALEAETKFLAAKGEALASKLEAEAYTGYWPEKADMTVSVSVEDKADGRGVRYSAKVLKTDALQCKIKLERREDSYCRYSTADGAEGLNEIAGLKMVFGKNIEADAKLTKLQADQIRLFLGNNGGDDSVKEMIEHTDDGYLTTGTVTYKSGRKLTYYGAYGGDNPVGIFFNEGTMEVVGENGDGSVCLR